MLMNPFFVYVLAFGATLGIYSLGWSSLYPALTCEMLLFFGLTFIAAIAAATAFSFLVRSPLDYRPGLLPRYFGIIVVLTFLAEVALNGIPLLRVLRGEQFFRLEAVATHLHVFSIWSVYSTIRYADYLYSGRRLYLLEASLPVLFYGLFLYRGPAIIVLTSWMFVFIIRHNGLKWKHFAIAACAGVLALYINGKMGDARSPGHENAGAPSASFKATNIPPTFFWTYLYATAPIANFQLAVTKRASDHGTIGEFVLTELVPDTFSKRILPWLNPAIKTGGYLETRDQLYSWAQPTIAPGINVSTIFGRSYGYFGWWGPTVMFSILALFLATYLYVSSWSAYQVPSIALLNTLVVFCLFNNMLASAAMIPLLVWPLVFPPWHLKKSNSNVVPS